MKKMSRIIAIALLLSTVAVVLLAQPKGAPERMRAINPPGTPQGLPFSNGLLVGNTLYVAGEQGADANGKLVPGGIGPETRATLETIQKVVREAGFQMKDVVAVNVYLADIQDFGEMNKVYKTFFPDPKPTRTTIQAARLVNDARIEISAIAVMHQ
ncbi:MAG: RidA family protein [Acidobacteria bacterium]|nr:MAG: RidA family protein [Acidobacteriota bacterium]